MTIEARWKGAIIARSDATKVVEGNHYFPREDVSQALLVESSHTSFCPWKGEAKYYAIVVDGDRNDDAAWYYPEPKDAAAEIRDHLAFWKGVDVSEA